MPCCLLVLILFAFPRAVLVLMFLFSNYLQHAYHGLLVPVLGFIFLPVTTVVYAWLVNTHSIVGGEIGGLNLILLLIAVIIDLGSFGGGEWHRRRRW
jgi:hypothetical protein